MGNARVLSKYFLFAISVLKYLAQLYCVCVVWNNLETNQVVDINFDWIHVEENYPQMIWLKYDAFEVNRTNIDNLIRMGIDNGCQVQLNKKIIYLKLGTCMK